ncbi:metallophosphoesterase family protein [Lactobacillus psittaci]|uniref:Phosphoesterase n=1 Tax=Lactobacillus psittaci DSM 15354 TaxID=1122152 RepID=A0A0R1SB36_9LACO|nr:DNA repair exonuclease [Lactobacillus psittaci]KRL63778.1 phosphoesterase [Lactobacillus psittaci DSM 15354]
MKFIHLADAHLDSPFRGLSFLPLKTYQEIKNAANQSFKAIVDLAIRECVDLVLIAGDTFDSIKPSPKSQIFFCNQVARLTDAEIQVVMILGNHDYINPENLAISTSPYFHLLGSNEVVESLDLETESGFSYQVNGFSYQHNHLKSNFIPLFPPKGHKYTIGMMHAGAKSSEPSQNVYAPFELKEIRNLNYDYFALGHIHLRQILCQNPLVVYPGNIQGRHINELGAKGCYLVDVDENSGKTKLTFKQTAPILWQKVELNLTKSLSQNDLVQVIKDTLAENNHEQTFIYLEISNAQYLSEEEVEFLQDHDVWQSFSEQLAFNSQVVDLRMKSQLKLSLAEKDQLAFEKAKEELLTSKELSELIKPLIKKDTNLLLKSNSESFEAQVNDATVVKLAEFLKGITDETNTN